MMRNLVRLALVAKRDVILDRTHLTRESRSVWLETARYCGVPILAVVFPRKPAIVHARRRFHTDSRGRSFDDWAQVAAHHEGQAEAEPIGVDEGFTEIRYLESR